MRAASDHVAPLSAEAHAVRFPSACEIAEITTAPPTAAIRGPRRIPKASLGSEPTVTGGSNFLPPLREVAQYGAAFTKRDVERPVGRDCDLRLSCSAEGLGDYFCWAGDQRHRPAESEEYERDGHEVRNGLHQAVIILSFRAGQAILCGVIVFAFAYFGVPNS